MRNRGLAAFACLAVVAAADLVLSRKRPPWILVGLFDEPAHLATAGVVLANLPARARMSGRSASSRGRRCRTSTTFRSRVSRVHPDVDDPRPVTHCLLAVSPLVRRGPRSGEARPGPGRAGRRRGRDARPLRPRSRRRHGRRAAPAAQRAQLQGALSAVPGRPGGARRPRRSLSWGRRRAGLPNVEEVRRPRAARAPAPGLDSDRTLAYEGNTLHANVVHSFTKPSRAVSGAVPTARSFG